MRNSETTKEIVDLLASDDEVKQVYDRQKSIIKVAELVKALRNDAGLTQVDLANILGTRQTAVSRMESYDCDTMPNLETLINIFHACGRELNLNASYSAQSISPSSNLANPVLTKHMQIAF